MKFPTKTLLAAILFWGVASVSTLHAEDEMIKIAFGSCNHQNAKQPLWKNILEEQPTVWIWLGDNIYGDSTDMAVMRQKYDRNKSHPGYVALREIAEVFGTWDDHDYGLNDGGKEFTAKKESKAEFVRFMGFPEDHEIHHHAGVYHSSDIVRAGLKIRIICPDTRYFRDSIVRKKEPGWLFARYQPNFDGTLLGDAQWRWLETQLDGEDFDLCIIASSIQLISEEHAFEKWANFPNDRAKMLNLIESKCPGKAIVISGDRHHSEISKIALGNTGKFLVDITSSGLTQRGGLPNEKNKHRVGPFNGKINYGVMTIDAKTKLAVYEIKGIESNVISRLEQQLD